MQFDYDMKDAISSAILLLVLNVGDNNTGNKNKMDKKF